MDTTGSTTADRRVVVGVDGSPGARAALVWALAAAARSGARLEVVTAVPVDLTWTDDEWVEPPRLDGVLDDTAARARAAVDGARIDAGPDTDGVPVEVTVDVGAPGDHLVQRSSDADLLVVGSRGRGAVRSTLLGSVALTCAAHARCPVVVVHPAAEPASPRVVVGVDDTPLARRALARAVEEAVRMGARVEAVAAYRAPEYWSDLYAVMAPPVGQTREEALERSRRIVDHVLAERADDARPEVAVEVEEGRAGEVLARRAERATLLVVGSRSRNRMLGMVLGSVALHAVVHARCPVMVVHPDPTGHEGAPAVEAASASG